MREPQWNLYITLPAICGARIGKICSLMSSGSIIVGVSGSHFAASIKATMWFRLIRTSGAALWSYVHGSGQGGRGVKIP